MAAAAEHVEEHIEQQPEPTLREQLIEARDEAVARQTGEVEDTPARARDEGGRFTKGENNENRPARGSDPASQKPGKPAASAPRRDDQSIADPVTQSRNGSPDGTNRNAVSGVAAQPTQSAVEPAPQSWTAAEKAAWANIPAEARAAISRREAEIHKTVTQHDQVRSVGNEFMRAATEYGPLIQARGNNPVGLFREFLGILNTIHTSDPVSRGQFLRDLSVRLGADPRALGVQAPADGQQPSPQSVPPIHPAFQQMSQEWNAFKQQQAQEKQRQAQEAQQREELEMQQTAAEIDSFRSKPEAKHFDVVNGLMASLLRDGHASNLEEAYNLAVRAHPEVSKAVAAEEQATRAAEEQKQREAARKRRAGGSVRGGYGGAQEVTGSKGSVRDDLVAAFESARGRV